MTRRDIALAVARDIEAFDNCAVLSNDSITAIERAVAQYSFDRLVHLRDRIASLTLSAHEKARTLELLDALLREDEAV